MTYIYKMCHWFTVFRAKSKYVLLAIQTFFYPFKNFEIFYNIIDCYSAFQSFAKYIYIFDYKLISEDLTYLTYLFIFLIKFY